MGNDMEVVRQHVMTHVDVSAKLLSLLNEKPEPFPIEMEAIQE